MGFYLSVRTKMKEKEMIIYCGFCIVDPAEFDPLTSSVQVLSDFTSDSSRGVDTSAWTTG